MSALTELTRVMDSVCKDKGIDREEIATAVEEAVLSAAHKLFRMQDLEKELWSPFVVVAELDLHVK